jgi:phosphinothricin acetyltransferase
MSAVVVRNANIEDLKAITPIYAHHVLHGTATFEIEPPDQSEMSRRYEGVSALGLSYLVAEVDAVIAGYAYASPYRPRPAYRLTVEDSVYLRWDFIGKGLGRLLLSNLIQRCQEKQLRQMVAIIGDSENAASIGLHARLGFRHVGTLEAVGCKFGRWLDTIIMQKTLE